MFKVNKEDTRTIPMGSFWCLHFDFKDTLYLILVFLLLALNM